MFPHDNINEKEKYYKRLERLKKIILDENNFICLVYVSVSSLDSGNYTLDGIEPIKNIYENIEKINKMLKRIRNNFKIVVFDTSKPIEMILLDDNVFVYELNKQNVHDDLMPELIEKFESIQKM